MRTSGAPKAVATSPASAEGPVAVRFARSAIEAAWTPAAGSLLDLAEASGLAPPFACRSGVCGTCATGLTDGQIDYVEAPSAPLGDGEVLLCCAVPGAPGEGEDAGVVLDL